MSIKVKINAATAKGIYRYPMIRLPREYGWSIGKEAKVEDTPEGVLIKIRQPLGRVVQQGRNPESRAERSDSDSETPGRRFELLRCGRTSGFQGHRLSGLDYPGSIGGWLRRVKRVMEIRYLRLSTRKSSDSTAMAAGRGVFWVGVGAGVPAKYAAQVVQTFRESAFSA